MVRTVQKEIRSLTDPKRARTSAWFFKTGPGQYGEGDVFLGITVPSCRKLANKYKKLPLSQVLTLLKSKYHEERLIALLILVKQYPENPKTIYDFYLKNTKYINNWDLVDLSAPKIIGQYLLDKPKNILFHLVKSVDIWERRISIISTFTFIYAGKPETTLRLAAILLRDRHDLIHKATGWMLREVGKRCGEKYLTEFLDLNHRLLPRTMLRYAIERLPEKKRKYYLNLR